jgi:hypothetical protein
VAQSLARTCSSLVAGVWSVIWVDEDVCGLIMFVLMCQLGENILVFGCRCIECMNSAWVDGNVRVKQIFGSLCVVSYWCARIVPESMGMCVKQLCLFFVAGLSSVYLSASKCVCVCVVCVCVCVRLNNLFCGCMCVVRLFECIQMCVCENIYTRIYIYIYIYIYT